MSRRCDICARGSKKAVSRSHSNIATLRRQYLNLQTKVVDGKTMKVCTSCIRTFSTKGRWPKKAAA